MRAKGFLYQPPLQKGCKDWVGTGYPYTFYDAFNPEAREAVLVADEPGRSSSRGVDAWWMDATEPDLVQPTPTLDAPARRT